MRKKSYNLQVCNVEHCFVFKSPIPSSKVVLKIQWSYWGGQGEILNTGVFDWALDFDNSRIVPNKTNPTIKKQFEASEAQFRKGTYGPAARKQIETFVKRALKSYGIPVTSLSYEVIDIHMIASNSGERKVVRFSGSPGQDQAYFCIFHSEIGKWGHPYIDIKDYHSLVSFAKKIIPMGERVVNAELSYEELMEFMRLYNAD